MLTKENYPILLVEKILGESPGFLVSLNDDMCRGLEYVLSTLNEREQFIIKEMYINKKRRKDIAAELGISIERVYQILHGAYRKLMHPNKVGFISNGVMGYIDFKEARAYKQGLEHGYEKGIKNIPIRRTEDDISKISIEELDLSIRAYNILLRAGILTVKDCVKCNHPENIRNIKKHDISNVVGALRNVGITGTAWDKFI